MMRIEVLRLKDRASGWKFYVRHNWTPERAQESVDRLNRQAPRSRLYRAVAESDFSRIKGIDRG